jgi:hypothetical protein
VSDYLFLSIFVYFADADTGRGPTAEKSHGSKLIFSAGDPSFSLKSPLAGSTNKGSATMLWHLFMSLPACLLV